MKHKVRLSTAIRIGAAKRPQAFCMAFDGIGTCVIGAAHEGTGGKFDQGPVVGFDILADLVWRGFSLEALTVAKKMNDSERISREEIADWLEAQGY